MGVIDGLQRPVTPAHTGWGDEAVGEKGTRGWAALPTWRCKSPLCCCLFRRHVVMRRVRIYILNTACLLLSGTGILANSFLKFGISSDFFVAN